ncbi:hypothetical protein AVEN_41186-1 [Araneus ventricosus]|uniref:C2H2-type domain-containing protein n=1 Tax=Araneus ventricosus TaxID=182803 RepID=A0A4Y2PDY6_ARAVE|nr:hypothetical protein AVEN_41186-1 [Araneus ventricosus]
MSSLSCEICYKKFNGEIPYKDHLASEKHKKKVEDLKNSFNSSEWHQDPLVKYVGFCTICRMSLGGLDQIKSHIHGGTHIKAKHSIQCPKEFPQIFSQSSFDNLPSTSANIPDPRIEINEYIDKVEQLVENIKVLVSKL